MKSDSCKNISSRSVYSTCKGPVLCIENIIDTCLNGREAIRSIKTNKPDLVFLDIQMPGFDGFSVVQGLMEVEPPLVVFVTAYSDHAIRAFEAQATDYLMKPVEPERLADSLDRVRQRLAEKRGVEEVERLKEVLAEHAPEAHGETKAAEKHKIQKTKAAAAPKKQKSLHKNKEKLHTLSKR